jgi:hypothetical protein
MGNLILKSASGFLRWHINLNLWISPGHHWFVWMLEFILLINLRTLWNLSILILKAFLIVVLIRAVFILIISIFTCSTAHFLGLALVCEGFWLAGGVHETDHVAQSHHLDGKAPKLLVFEVVSVLSGLFEFTFIFLFLLQAVAFYQIFRCNWIQRQETNSFLIK